MVQYLMVLMTVAAAGDGLTLVRDGASEYVITVPADAPASVRTAAAELQTHLAGVTGVTLPIGPEGEADAGTPAIVLGLGARFQAAFPQFDARALKHDGIVIRTKGRDLFLAGDDPRGTLYAVYSFLEDVVGCRWWTATESYLPDRPSLEIQPLDRVYVPALRCREAYYRGAFDGTFAARLKLNGHHHRIPEEFGGHSTILGWCHTFYALLPPERYFAEHPEWYSEIDGKRVADGGQLCLTNPEMRAELVKNALEWLRGPDGADADLISISQNDWHGRCLCADCARLEDEEGSPSGPLLHLVNAVAEAVEKEFPDVLVETLAYQYTREAPRHVRPRSNVVIRLCSIECSFSEPLAEGARNAAFKRDMEAWSAIAPQLYVWDYVTNFANYLLPHPNHRVLAPNIRFFVDHKTVGLFEQGDAGSTCSDFPELRTWLLAHLMWDPSQDEATLTAAFMDGYYGAAAEPLRAYIEVLHDTVEAADTHLRCFMEDTASWLTPEALVRATAIFDEAEAQVADDPVRAPRVRRARLPLDNAWINRYHGLKRVAKIQGTPFAGPEDPAAFAEEFIRTARRFDVGQYREGVPFEQYEAILRSRFRPQGPPPELCTGMDDTRWVDFQDNEFSLHRRGEWSTIEEDAAASDGLAARMPASHTQWAVQLPVSTDARGAGRLRCYVVARCDAGAASGEAFDVGIYDTAAGVPVTARTVTVEEAAGAAYRTFDLGEHDLGSQVYVWVAPRANPETVSAVWVDRIFFVRPD